LFNLPLLEILICDSLPNVPMFFETFSVALVVVRYEIPKLPETVVCALAAPANKDPTKALVVISFFHVFYLLVV